MIRYLKWNHKCPKCEKEITHKSIVCNSCKESTYHISTSHGIEGKAYFSYYVTIKTKLNLVFLVL